MTLGTEYPDLDAMTRHLDQLARSHYELDEQLIIAERSIALLLIDIRAAVEHGNPAEAIANLHTRYGTFRRPKQPTWKTKDGTT